MSILTYISGLISWLISKCILTYPYSSTLLPFLLFIYQTFHFLVKGTWNNRNTAERSSWGGLFYELIFWMVCTVTLWRLTVDSLAPSLLVFLLWFFPVTSSHTPSSLFRFIVICPLWANWCEKKGGPMCLCTLRSCQHTVLTDTIIISWGMSLGCLSDPDFNHLLLTLALQLPRHTVTECRD